MPPGVARNIAGRHAAASLTVPVFGLASGDTNKVLARHSSDPSRPGQDRPARLESLPVLKPSPRTARHVEQTKSADAQIAAAVPGARCTALKRAVLPVTVKPNECVNRRGLGLAVTTADDWPAVHPNHHHRDTPPHPRRTAAGLRQRVLVLPSTARTSAARRRRPYTGRDAGELTAATRNTLHLARKTGRTPRAGSTQADTIATWSFLPSLFDSNTSGPDRAFLMQVAAPPCKRPSHAFDACKHTAPCTPSESSLTRVLGLPFHVCLQRFQRCLNISTFFVQIIFGFSLIDFQPLFCSKCS